MTDDKPIEVPAELSSLDRWILSRLSFMVESVNEALSENLFSKATLAIKQFTYYEFCDYFIVSITEVIKPHFSYVKMIEFNIYICILMICRKERNQDLGLNELN